MCVCQSPSRIFFFEHFSFIVISYTKRMSNYTSQREKESRQETTTQHERATEKKLLSFYVRNKGFVSLTEANVVTKRGLRR